MRTSDQTRPETLLAAVNTFFTDMVILPPAVVTQEERPFQPPFLASAHRQSCSGTSRPGFLPSGGLCSAHSRLASSNRSRMEGFSGFVCSACSCAFSSSSPRLPLLIMQKCVSLSWLTTMKTWLKKKLLRKLLVLVVLRRVPKLLLLLQLKLLQLKNQKLNQLNNFTVILIHIKKATHTGSLFCILMF